MATVRVEFHDRESVVLEHVSCVIDDFESGRVTFQHRAGSVSYDSDDLSGWGVDPEDDQNERS